MNSLMEDFHENRQLFKNAPKMYSNENARKQIATGVQQTSIVAKQRDGRL